MSSSASAEGASDQPDGCGRALLQESLRGVAGHPRVVLVEQQPAQEDIDLRVPGERRESLSNE